VVVASLGICHLACFPQGQKDNKWQICDPKTKTEMGGDSKSRDHRYHSGKKNCMYDCEQCDG